MTSEHNNIWIACSNGDISAVEELIRAGADINGQDESGYSPLHAAVSWNYEKLVERLIEMGADVNIRDADGDTPLHVCERTDICQLLIDAQADALAKNSEDRLPIETAFIEGHEEVVELLKQFTPELDLEAVEGSDDGERQDYEECETLHVDIDDLVR